MDARSTSIAQAASASWSDSVPQAKGTLPFQAFRGTPRIARRWDRRLVGRTKDAEARGTWLGPIASMTDVDASTVD